MLIRDRFYLNFFFFFFLLTRYSYQIDKLINENAYVFQKDLESSAFQLYNFTAQ